MGELIQPESMTTWMRDMERRMRAVESAPKLLTVQYTRVRGTETFLSTTSSTFVTVWEVALGRVVNDAVQISVTATASAGTSGEMRLRTYAWGEQLSATQTVLDTPGGVNRTWNWLIPGMADQQGTTKVILQIQARRTAGAGNVNLYDPDLALQCSGFSIGATSTGV